MADILNFTLRRPSNVKINILMSILLSICQKNRVWPWLLIELKLFRSRAMAYWSVTMVTVLSVGCKLNLQMIQWLYIST